MTNNLQINFLRIITKILLKSCGWFLLSPSMISFSRKVSTFAIQKIGSNDGIYSIQGFKIKTGKDSRSIVLSEDYEHSETVLLKKLIKNGMVVFDIGANIGWYALILSKLVGSSGHVYAFEPDPYHFKILKENVELNNLKNVSIFQFAVSNYVGKAKFSFNVSVGISGRLESNTLFDNFEYVDVITLDEFCNQNDVNPDLIKMDVEGSEVKIFDGMKKMISKNHNIKIISEFFPQAISDVGSSPKDYLNSLESADFKIHQILDGSEGEFETVTKDKLLKICGNDYVNLYCFKNLP